MAVEAQVCPQCGAAVQFAPGQTEVVCGHCGTTVVKAAAPGATTVAKELADEKLIQAAVALEHSLAGHGQRAAAKIVTAQPMDIFRPTLEGRAVLMSFAVEVQPDGQPPFTADTKVLVGLNAVDKYRAGTLLNVLFDPQRHDRVAVEGRRGSDGNTVRSPEQRRADHAAKEKKKEWEQAHPQHPAPAGQPAAPAPLAPAWGGGQHGLALPAGFDAVTSLGPAAAVHAHLGLRLPFGFGTPRASELVRYHDGVAFRAHGAEIHTWRWEAIAAIQSNVTVHTGVQGGGHMTEQQYPLTHSSGEVVILDDSVQDLGTLIVAIKQAVYSRLTPPLLQRYQANESLAFGPVTVQREHGLQLDGKTYAWNAIQDIKVDDGRLKLALGTGQKHEAHVSAIPNIEVLCQLIGVKLESSFGLGHWV